MTINTQTPGVQQASTAKAAASMTQPPEDTVQLSSAAKAALNDVAQGDPDHDGH
jgi:hypothetical protein